LQVTVGLLYSSQLLVELCGKSAVQVSSFKDDFPTFEVSPGESVLAISTQCGWLDASGPTLKLTARGMALQQAAKGARQLRHQLQDIIENLHPAWSVSLRNGRQESVRGMPAEIRQCLQEAGLMQPPDDAIRTWWTRCATIGRFLHSLAKVDSGQEGELATISHERKRTGKEPYWQAFESNFAGYDVESVVEKDSMERLLIESKYTVNKFSQASFFLSRNEWQVAAEADHYVFHLWAAKPTLSLLVVPADRVAEHIPENRGKGNWKDVEILMSPFMDCKVEPL
jgi:hypothetical protein